jgi:cell division protein FtsQ
MAEDYLYTGDVLPEEKTIESSRFSKGLKWLLIAVCLTLGAYLVWLLGITPFMPFYRISVTSLDSLSREAILGVAGVTAQSSFISTNTREAEKALKALPQIESVKIVKRFPDRLEISAEGRRALAVALTELDGKPAPVIFDSRGVIFHIGPAAMGDGISELPLISGIDIARPVPGDRLPAALNTFLSDLETIRLNSPELLNTVSEIRLVRKSFDGFDLVLYPVHKKIRVRLSALNEELLRYTLLMVDVLSAEEPEIDTLDFRSGLASYTLKEASSEQ